MMYKIMPQRQADKARQGFTLIELSIVLVIIGLIVGGIFVGRDLINAAALRGIVKQVEEYETAVNTFRVKYNCLPGDCLNATDFWGTAAACNGPGNHITAYSPLTCNGNGNGHLVGSMAADIVNTNNTSTPWENLTFWQHLVNAGLISGSYVGQFGDFNNGIVPGTNVPLLRTYPNAIITVSNEENTVSNHWYNNQPIFMTGVYNVGLGRPNDPYLTPAEALALDMKFDSGHSSTGKIRFDWGISSGSCVNGTSPVGYDTTKTGIGCSLYFIENF